MSTKPVHLLAIVGPTAVGKTRMVVELKEVCEQIEVISADSRQFYRYMDIGTAKPIASELEKIPHHFINIKNPDETFNAGQFGSEGRKTVQELIAQNKNPVVVGGSGLYIRSLIDGLFQAKAADAKIKEMLRQRAAKEGLHNLYKELKIVDEKSASKIHPNDKQRIIRALEAWYVTGEPISTLRKQKHPEIDIYPILIGLNREREKLYEIIEMRIDRMREAGFVDEVHQLRQMGYSKELQSQKTLGYQEIHDFLDGETTEDEAFALIKRNTRRFAKRQLTWFRRDQRIRWFDVDNREEWQAAKATISEQLSMVGRETADGKRET